MFILRKKGTNKYVAEYNSHTHTNKEFTTNINEARTFVNLDDMSRSKYVTSEYDPETRSWTMLYSGDFDILEVEISIKRKFDNVKKG